MCEPRRVVNPVNPGDRCLWLVLAIAISLVLPLGAHADELAPLIERIEQQRIAAGDEFDDLVESAVDEHLAPERIGELDEAGELGAHIELLRLVAPHLDADEGEAIREALWAGPLDDEQLIAGLTYQQIDALRQARRHLGVEHQRHLSLLRRWIEQSDHAQEIDPPQAAELLWHYRSLTSEAAREEEARADVDAALARDAVFQAFVRRLHQRFLAQLPRDPEALAAVNELMNELGQYLSDVQRNAVADQVRGAWFSDETALEQMTVAQFQQAILLAASLQREPREPFNVLLRFVEHSQRLSDASSRELAFILDYLRNATRQADPDMRQRAVQGQSRVLSIVLDRIASLTNPEQPSKQRSELVLLMRMAFDAGDDADRRRMREALDLALAELLREHADPAEVLDGPVGRVLRANLQGLGDAELTQAVTTAYVEASDRWRDREAADLATLYQRMSPPRDQRVDLARLRVFEQASQEVAQMLDFLEEVSNGEGLPDKALFDHVERRLPALLESEDVLTAQMLARLAAFFAGHPDVDQGRRWLVETLDLHLQRDGELVGAFEEFRTFGAIVRDFQIDDELRQLAVTPEGSVRLSVAKVLAWVHSERESMYAWREYLEEAAEQGGLSGDARARWYLAQAYAALVPPAELSAVVGRDWIRRAFAVAESEALRFDALEWLVEMHVEAHRFDEARSILASVRHQFESEAAREQLAALDTEVRERHEAAEAHERLVRHQRRLRRMEARVEAMRRRIEQAREQGRAQADIASLERMREGFEADLEKARADASE